MSIPNTATLGGLDVLGTATVNGLLYQLGNTVSPNNVLYVQKGPLTAPNQFNSINAALATITTNSANNPFAIVVAPGIYTETTITMKQYVSLIGNDPHTSIVQTASATQNLIVPAPNSTIGNLTLQGAGAGLPGSGYAAISYAATGKVYVNNCYFGANDVLLNQVTASPNCIITLFNCEVAPTSNFSIGFNTQSIGGVKVVLNIEKLVWGQTASNPNFVNFINAIGAGTLVTILDTIVLPTVLLNGNFLNIVNATTATIFSSLVTNFARGGLCT